MDCHLETWMGWAQVPAAVKEKQRRRGAKSPVQQAWGQLWHALTNWRGRACREKAGAKRFFVESVVSRSRLPRQILASKYQISVMDGVGSEGLNGAIDKEG